jgi:hypothetical protein
MVSIVASENLLEQQRTVIDDLERNARGPRLPRCSKKKEQP